MFVKLLTTVFFFISLLSQFLKSSSQTLDFTYNGFPPPLSDISLQGIATVTPNGLLKLTTQPCSKPVTLSIPNLSGSKILQTHRLVILHNLCLRYPLSDRDLSGHGIAFVVAPNASLPFAGASQYMGLFNVTNNGDDTNHVFAVELDTIHIPSSMIPTITMSESISTA
ncbi:unnamed protein product [Microthlaspi erraticum]|uniref:Legume lectin domain-containing protein n=1 Tax=Microthlaspi erraticum TaxID=1685480 RepID=A0A6D2ITA5_9BRAS|nr:unnamed protein product [Microthlaspi erraticum]